MSTPKIVTSRSLAAFAALAVVVTACSSEATSTSATTSPTTAPASSAPTTTAEVSATTSVESSAVTSTTTEQTTTTVTETTTTTAASTTTMAATTTTEPATPETGLTLATNGVLPFAFGDDDTIVIDGLTTALGTPKFDGAQTYSDAEADYYLDSTGEEGFDHPIGRTVCFVNDLCTQFGGSTVDTLTFTGWDLMSDAAPRLFTLDAITVGSVISDFGDVVDIDIGGCYTVGYGSAGGVALTVLSSGELFGSFNDDGEYIIGDPSPADLTVVRLHAGDLPFFLFDDC